MGRPSEWPTECPIVLPPPSLHPGHSKYKPGHLSTHARNLQRLSLLLPLLPDLPLLPVLSSLSAYDLRPRLRPATLTTTMNQQSQMMHPQPQLHAPPQQYRQQQPQPPATTTGIVLSNNLVIFLAVAGLCGYTVYTTGNLQHFIYAVSALYVLRLFLRNPEILKQLHAQIQSLQGQYYHRGLVPVATVSPVPARVSPPPMNHATLAAASAPAAPSALAHHHTQEMHSAVPVHPQEPLVAPRLDMNFLDQVRPDGYQPLPARLPNIDEFDAPFTPIPSYSSSSYNPAIGSPQGAANHQLQRRIPSRSASRAESRIAAVSGINATPENYPQRNQAPSRSLYDANAGALPSSTNLANLANLTPAAAAAARVAAAVAAMRPDSRMSDFAMPIQNPYGSYSHYDAGTINGQRLAALSEDAHHQQQQLERPPSVSEIIAAPPSQRSASAGSTSRVSPRSNTIAVSAPTATAPVNKDEFVPKRKHRVPTMSARVGEVFAPGAGIAPPPPLHESPVKFFNSPLVNSPSASSSHQQQQNGLQPLSL
ncbi:hypothetical protein FRC20_003091 [Serendipita sp. 405]|nr:hypothetical protein FRC18_003580 [Serendipita sp. 400]KAG8845953.1 hypothetical protein FRC20_003091 [Serendipita sp. 405]